jgi:hypothetical protein
MMNTKPTDYQRHPYRGARIADIEQPRSVRVGRPGVVSAQTYREGDYYRWVIRTRRATYVDGGNYTSRLAAEQGLRDALYGTDLTPVVGTPILGL